MKLSAAKPHILVTGKRQSKPSPLAPGLNGGFHNTMFNGKNSKKSNRKPKTKRKRNKKKKPSPL